MKKFCLFLIVIILALFSFSACNYNSGEITELKEDMTAEELFDYLKKQDSFSIQVDNLTTALLKIKDIQFGKMKMATKSLKLI